MYVGGFILEKIKKQRNTNVEYLRLLAAFMIVVNHYALHGEFAYASALSINSLLIQFLHSCGKIGVCIFLFISGYYSSTSKKYQFRHIAKFVLEVAFYSVVFAAVGFGLHTMTLSEIGKMVFSIPFNEWQYVTSYFLVLCLSFWTNKLIYALTEKQFLGLLLFLLVTWSLIPTFFKGDFALSNFTFYMMIYLIAGYLRRIEYRIKLSGKTLIYIGLGAYGLILLSVLAIDVVGELYLHFILHFAEHFRNLPSIFVIVTSGALTLGVIRLKPSHNKFVQTIASTTLGIFIIHENRAIRPFLWTEILCTKDFTDSGFLFLHALLTCAALTAVCIVIDLIRQQTVGRLEGKLFGRWIDSTEEKINTFLDVSK